MRHSFIWLFSALILAGCSSFQSIPYSPSQTPETWLTIQPFVEFQVASQPIILVQPSTTAIVYLLGIVTVGAGLYFLRIRKAHRSRFWWGIALLLWGIGALFAGTSYEAFSYQIKCLGRDACIWTSWWELCYLVLSVASVDAMLIAEAYACTSGKWRNNLKLYAFVSVVLYLITVLIGAFLPNKFLISFELLLLVSAPNIVIFLILNGWRYSRLKQRKDLVLLGTWGGLILTIAAYFLYYISGLTQRLWASGLWFSENDVLHIGLILWMGYILLVMAPYVEDIPVVLT